MPGDAELLLGLDLGRQAVAVPAEAAVHDVAAHRPVAGHGVLDEAGQQVAVVRQAVGERRPVVEHELGRPPAGPRAGRSTRRTCPRAPSARRSAPRCAGSPGCGGDDRDRRASASPVGCGLAHRSVSCARSFLRRDDPAAIGCRDRGPTLLAPRLGGSPLCCAGDDGPDPFGSTGAAGAARSSEGSEVMASSSPVVTRLSVRPRPRSRGFTAPICWVTARGPRRTGVARRRGVLPVGDLVGDPRDLGDLVVLVDVVAADRHRPGRRPTARPARPRRSRHRSRRCPP